MTVLFRPQNLPFPHCTRHWRDRSPHRLRLRIAWVAFPHKLQQPHEAPVSITSYLLSFPPYLPPFETMSSGSCRLSFSSGACPPPKLRLNLFLPTAGNNLPWDTRIYHIPVQTSTRIPSYSQARTCHFLFVILTLGLVAGYFYSLFTFSPIPFFLLLSSKVLT